MELIKQGADVNYKDYWGTSLLHTASSSGNFDIFSTLHCNGADLTWRDMQGCTPLHPPRVICGL